MKKVMLILSLILISSCLFATDTVSVVMSLDMTEEMEHFVEIGFVEPDVLSRSIELASYELEKTELEIDETGGGAILSKDLQVYWNVSSPNSFRVMLTGSPFMDESGSILNYSASWIPHEEDEEVSIGRDGDMSAQKIYSHHPENSLSHSGTADLRIETDELINAIPGHYHGVLTLIVEDE